MDYSQLKNKNEAKRLLELSIRTGRFLLLNGGEVYRVEDTIWRMCCCKNNIHSVDVFVTPTVIIAALEFEGENISMIRRIRGSAIDLNVIHDINSFSRTFTENSMSLEEAEATLKKISNKSIYPNFLKNFATAMSSAFFSVLFGGDIRDFVSTFLITYVLVLLLFTIKKLNLSFFIETFLSSILASVGAIFMIYIGFGNHLDSIVTGIIMLLVPGYLITTSVRDTLYGDYISGSSKASQAIYVAFAVALGCGIVLNMYLKGVII